MRHTYRTSLAWSGSTAGGYEDYDRGHTLTAPPARPALELSSDPAFKGDADRLNPEQLLLAAASSCQLLEFLVLSAKARIDVLEYHDDAEATMDESDEPARIQRIALRPRIAVAAGPSEDRVRHLVELAHDHCYVANTLRSEMIVEPEIELRG